MADIREFIDEDKYVTYFYKAGRVNEGNIEVVKDDRECLAKKIVHIESGRERFYIKKNRIHGIMNPFSNNVSNIRQSDNTWYKVDESLFKDYLQFLRTGRQIFFAKVKRNQ